MRPMSYKQIIFKRARIKLGGLTFLVFLAFFLMLAHNVEAINNADLRKIGESYANPMEAVAINGPYFVGQKEYFVFEYFDLGKSQDTLVFDSEKGSFLSEDVIYNKVLATKDLSTLLINDPLFYSVGDPSKILLAAKYEVENVRNFATYVSLTEDDIVLLEEFLTHYEEAVFDITKTIALTNKMLYPEDMFSFSYSRDPPSIGLEVIDTASTRGFSYEGFQELQDEYNRVKGDYLQLTNDLIRLSGNFEEYPVGTPIREKWGIVITTDTLQQQTDLLVKNGVIIDEEVNLRNQILVWDYKDRKSTAKLRLKDTGIAPEARSIAIFFLFFLLTVIAIYYKKKKPPGLFMLLLMMVIAPVASEGLIPKPSDIISMKVKDVTRVPIIMDSNVLDEATARNIISGYPFLLEGEGIRVSGPFYIEKKTHYLFEVTSGSKLTGMGFLVDGDQILVGDQRLAYRLIKVRFVRDSIKERPLYEEVDLDRIAENAELALPPVHGFLLNLSENIQEGRELERALIAKADWTTLEGLIGNYHKSFVLLNNIRQFLTPEEFFFHTEGFNEQSPWFEAYLRVMKGITTDEYLEGRIAMYRGRTLNRLPLMIRLTNMGFIPSKAQLVQDLSSDMLHDNYYFWRLGRTTDPALFARLAFKEGTVTYPTMLDIDINDTDG